MSDDSIMTERLRQLGETTEDEIESGQTIVLDESSIMETLELKQLLNAEPAEVKEPSGTDVMDLEEIADALGVPLTDICK